MKQRNDKSDMFCQGIQLTLHKTDYSPLSERPGSAIDILALAFRSRSCILRPFRHQAGGSDANSWWPSATSTSVSASLSSAYEAIINLFNSTETFDSLSRIDFGLVAPGHVFGGPEKDRRGVGLAMTPPLVASR
jgi:hypothetical protein